MTFQEVKKIDLKISGPHSFPLTANQTDTELVIGVVSRLFSHRKAEHLFNDDFSNS